MTTDAGTTSQKDEQLRSATQGAAKIRRFHGTAPRTFLSADQQYILALDDAVTALTAQLTERSATPERGQATIDEPNSLSRTLFVLADDLDDMRREGHTLGTTVVERVRAIARLASPPPLLAEQAATIPNLTTAKTRAGRTYREQDRKPDAEPR